MNRKSIIWRFGLIGIILYDFFYQKSIWSKKGFIFMTFTCTFIITFFLIVLLITKITSTNPRWLISLIFLGVCYGIWAHCFFQNKV